MKSALLRTLALLLLTISAASFAQLPSLISHPRAKDGQSGPLPVQTLVFIISLTLIPAILLIMTCFVMP